MREVVIVPTYKRPEFLYCALEAIRTAEPNIAIHVWPDRGTSEAEICEQFGAIEHMTIAHTYHGNSYVMLEALRWAYGQAYERVFVVEDDAIIDPTFFSWCRQALDLWPESFAACGWKYSPDAPMDERDGAPDVRISWYLSVCACLPRKSLFSIVQHARVEYYADMKGYLDRTYPASFRRGSRHWEQDGLILRVAESEGKRCIWPRRPRATHIGWTGYHTEGQAPKGTLQERVKVVKLAMRNPALLMSLMSGAPTPEVGACVGCGEAVLVGGRGKVVCVKCFHKEHPDWAVATKTHYYVKDSSSLIAE